MRCYLQAARASFTWRRVLFTQVLAQIVAVFVSFDEGFFGEALGHTSIHFVTMSVCAFLILPLAFCAEEAVTQGARPVLVYSALLVFVNPLLAAVTAAAIQGVYCIVFAIPWPAARWDFTLTGSSFSVSCSLALVVYMNGRAAERMLEGVRGAELKRVRMDQQLLESRLAMAEAQIDPQMLFGALAEIKRGFEESQPQAEKQLSDLIQTLRAALARTTAASAAESA